MNLSTIPELLENGTLALRLQSYDAESGVRTVDVYHLTGIEMKICHSHANIYVCHTQEPLLTQAFSGKLCKFGPYTCTTDLWPVIGNHRVCEWVVMGVSHLAGEIVAFWFPVRDQTMFLNTLSKS